MIIVAGSVRIGRREAALARFRALIEATRAEPGCLDYSFAFDALDENLIRIFEIYRNQAALEAHRSSPHFLAWRAAAADLEISARDLSEYEVAEARRIP